MEKFKWIILGILLIVLAVVVFRKPEIKEETAEKDHVTFKVSHTEKTQELKSPAVIKEGEYVLYPEEFQKIEGKGNGWHLRFSRPVDDKEMILEFDIVDTSGLLLNPVFPVQLYHDPYQLTLPGNQPPLRRGSFSVGYMHQTSKNTFQEDFIPMIQFSCVIDTAWTADSLGGIRMSFNATHSDMLKEVYGMRYSVSGMIDIDSLKFSTRIVQ